jgi:hypothetical protein
MGPPRRQATMFDHFGRDHVVATTIIIIIFIFFVPDTGAPRGSIDGSISTVGCGRDQIQRTAIDTNPALIANAIFVVPCAVNVVVVVVGRHYTPTIQIAREIRGTIPQR